MRLDREDNGTGCSPGSKTERPLDYHTAQVVSLWFPCRDIKGLKWNSAANYRGMMLFLPNKFRLHTDKYFQLWDTSAVGDSFKRLLWIADLS
jgi:hypothetical protein